MGNGCGNGRQLRSSHVRRLAAIGFVLFVTGIVLIILFSESQGIMKSLPFVCLGVGCGFIGGGIGGTVSYRKMKKNPNLAKQKEIDLKDERNIAIAYKAKAMAYNLTLLIFAALIVFLAVVQVETYITLVFTGAYLIVIFLYIYFFNRYHKEM